MRWIAGIVGVTVALWIGQEAAAKQPPVLQGKDKHVAEDLLRSGNHLFRNREYSLAEDYYRQVVTMYPGTRYEKLAKMRLRRVQAALKREQTKAVAKRGLFDWLFRWPSKTSEYVH